MGDITLGKFMHQPSPRGILSAAAAANHSLMISRLTDDEWAARERGLRITPALNASRPTTTARTKAMVQPKAAAQAQKRADGGEIWKELAGARTFVHVMLTHVQYPPLPTPF